MMYLSRYCHLFSKNKCIKTCNTGIFFSRVRRHRESAIHTASIGRKYIMRNAECGISNTYNLQNISGVCKYYIGPIDLKYYIGPSAAFLC